MSHHRGARESGSRQQLTKERRLGFLRLQGGRERVSPDSPQAGHSPSWAASVEIWGALSMPADSVCRTHSTHCAAVNSSRLNKAGMSWYKHP
ncbi:hypothetical protein NDU88_005134 [Pleurodeles waltl]|uniref:Uncharacterized protein n=1 Tax=Pleurodeles waltl TaxID=8319 RepID=A0AAV7WXN4_PLEWA|nr:hypothetical protein NDU88_005134 [Pleurodeles waltl]